MKFNFEFDQRVNFDNGVDKGNGLIKGCAMTEMPVIGAIYIVKVIDGFIPNETYPFDTMAVAECHLKPGFVMGT